MTALEDLLEGTTLSENSYTQRKTEQIPSNEEMERILSYIPAKEAYTEWVQVGMALKHSDYPMQLWDQWSRGASNYNAEELARKWTRELDKQTGQQRTYKSLIKEAKENGYTVNNQNYTKPADLNPLQKARNNVQQTNSRSWVDYSSFLENASEAILQPQNEGMKYLKSRGLTEETVKRFGLGYSKDPKGLGLHDIAGITIPANNSYVFRKIDPTETDKVKVLVPKGTERHLFQFSELMLSEEPVFLVEGELDAISIDQAGGHAMALGTNKLKDDTLKDLTDMIAKSQYNKSILIALDHDQAGQEGTANIISKLDTAGVLYIVLDTERLYSGCKDANEALQKDADTLRNRIREAVDQADKAKDIEKAEYLQKFNTASYMPIFEQEIIDSKSRKTLGTGFDALNKVLDGGLYEGLYTLTGETGAGKTAFILQLADNITLNGRDVLYISLEMAKSELIGRSISKITADMEVRKYSDRPLQQRYALAKTMREVTLGNKYRYYNSAEITAIQEAEQYYEENIGTHMFIVEGVGSLDVNKIRELIKRHVRVTGNVPVLVVDYLQILQPADPRATDKANTDKAILEFKRISRDYKTPVLVVSSMNRNNYGKEANLSALKESGAIEYSSDAVIGLQQTEEYKKRSDKMKTMPADIELSILKQRNGVKGRKIAYKYYSNYNYFLEIGEEK